MLHLISLEAEQRPQRWVPEPSTYAETYQSHQAVAQLDTITSDEELDLEGVEGDNDDDDNDDNDMSNTYKPLNNLQGLVLQGPNPLPPHTNLALNPSWPVRTQKVVDIPIFFEQIKVPADKDSDKSEDVTMKACRLCKWAHTFLIKIPPSNKLTGNNVKTMGFKPSQINTTLSMQMAWET
jgi:hypothetical protein